MNRRKRLPDNEHRCELKYEIWSVDVLLVFFFVLKKKNEG